MAFTLTFPTSAALPSASEVAEWLHQRGEPVELVGEHMVQLRALDLRIEVDERQARARLEMAPELPLSRVVDLLFDLSIFLGADVRLTGVGEVSRGMLWMALADDQDRVRIATALERARLLGKSEEVGAKLWQIVSAVRPGCDDRWDSTHERVVELKEVGAADGISIADAAWHVDDPEPGDVIPVPVEGHVHILAWRWLSEAYPGLAESEHSLG